MRSHSEDSLKNKVDLADSIVNDDSNEQKQEEEEEIKLVLNPLIADSIRFFLRWVSQGKDPWLISDSGMRGWNGRLLWLR